MTRTATPEDVLAGRARWCVVEGDSAEVLASLPPASVHALVTDPPAGIGFMGREWDRDRGGRAQWVAWLASVLGLARVAVRPGGRAFVWALPRTTHWTGCAVEDAGWAIETVVTHLFGTGWPKGQGQLKPSSEHWYLARTGPSTPLNVDGCRVGTQQTVTVQTGRGDFFTPGKWTGKRLNPPGRWPPNTLFSHSPGCERVGERRVSRREDSSESGSRVAVVSDANNTMPESVRGGIHGSVARPDPRPVVGVSGVEFDDDSAVCDEEVRAEAPSVDRQNVLMHDRESGCAEGVEQREFARRERQRFPGCVGDGAAQGEVRGIAYGSRPQAPDGAVVPAVCAPDPVERDRDGLTATGAGGGDLFSALVGAQLVGARDGAGNPAVSAEVRIGDAVDGGAHGARAVMSGHEDHRSTAKQDVTHETVEAWRCVEGCPVAELDAQSGECPGMKPARLVRGSTTGAGVGYGSTTGPQDAGIVGLGASGTASRFFPCFPADDPAQFAYIAKPSRAERNEGVCVDPQPRRRRNELLPGDCYGNDRREGNVHPTVKPVALMRWLIRLVTEPGDIVLDPFGGSFTTGVAALLEGRRFIGIERDPRYCEIGRARLQHAAPTRDRLRTMATAPIVAPSANYGPLFSREGSR